MSPHANILVVEDDPADAYLLKLAFEDCSLDATVTIVGDGDTALAYLGDAANPRPDLVLLDINLPGMNGFEILNAIREDPKLATLLVIMMSTSDDPADIDRAYLEHANSFVTKPSHVEALISALDTIDSYWFRIAKRPTQ